VLRAANGYTKRANSVQSLNANDDEDAPARLERAAAWFKARSLPPIFRVTPLTGKKALAALKEAKWEEQDESVVLAMELERSPPMDARAVVLDIGDPAFLAAQTALQKYDEGTAMKLSAVLWALTVPAKGIVLSHYDRPAASALVAVADGIAVAGNVVTGEADRGLGYGTATMQSALAWAFGQGARAAALNMHTGNTAASRLYGGLGYREVYGYHYRQPAT
jgi:GNAT superfamily N-acetyltransferase